MTEDYDEVEAIVRIPRGGRLVDSKETEGWNLGFTPKSTDGGPEFAKIRLKDDGECEIPDEPQIIYIHEYYCPPHEKTPEQKEAEELLAALIIVGLIKAAEWAHPRLQRLWEERVAPFFNARRLRRQQRKAQRKVRGSVPAEGPETVLEGVAAEDASEVSHALESYKANMTNAEARRHFTEALVAQRFANEKMRLLTEARIEDADVQPRELARAVQALTPKQVVTVLDSILASNPALIDDLGELIKSARSEGGFRLGSDNMKAALRLTDGR